MLALRKVGRFGLVSVDGHLHFRHPGNSVRLGAAAGEDLAPVIGRGPERLTSIDGLGPLVRDEDVVVQGEREDYPEWRDIHERDIKVWNLQELRTSGFAEAAERAVEKLRGNGVEGSGSNSTRTFWVTR
jgi:arginase